MVLYHFPPLGGVSMARNVANVTRLPSRGWIPVVLAARTPGEVVDDDALAMVPPELAVVRAWCPEPTSLRSVAHLVRALAGRRRAVAPAGEVEGPVVLSAGDPAGASAASSSVAPASTLARLRRIVFFPDAQVAWLPFALARGIRASRSGSVDAVYSTSSPVTAHLVAGLVSRLTGLPWVAEFRDPWVGNPLAEPLPWIHRRLRARLERWVVRSADRLVFLSPSTARAYVRRYGVGDKTEVISNGHDAGEAIPAAPRRPGRYRIVWTGSLYRPTELGTVLEAIARLAVRRPSLVDELEVSFYGDVEASSRAVADAYLRDPCVAAIVRFPGFVPRREALRAVAEADAALVLLGAGPGMGQFVPGKLFDYLGQDKQVLGVLPPGDAREILADLGWGVVADPEPGAIADAIERLLASPAPTRHADPEGRYERSVLAGRLSDTLNAAVASHPRRRAPASQSTEGPA